MSSGAVLPGELLQAAATYVRRRTGLVFKDSRRSALERALVRGMRGAKAGGPEVYLARLDGEPGLLDELVAEITVGETYFFREPQQLEVIEREILPALLEQRPQTRRLRIWCAGCASGEEPYTLAILLRQMGLDREATIVGTDLSRVALAKARRARYTRWSLRAARDEMVARYFERMGDQFELAPAVRAAVEFRYLNLAEDTYPSLPTGVWGMDLILCRNVLIYFDADTVARVARRLVDSLSDGGWLLLGASDPLIADLVPCEVVVTGAGLTYRRRGAPVPSPAPLPWAHRPAPAEVPGPEQPRAVPSPSELRVPPKPDVAEEAVRSYAARDYVRAAELAGRMLAQDGSDSTLWVVLVRAHANRGELSEAGRACAAALDRHPTMAELVYLHAVLLSEAGRHAEAAVAARRALYLDRQLVVAHLALGRALTRMGDSEGSRRAYGNAERLLAAMPSGALVPAADGEPAGRLAEIVRVQLQLLGEVPA
ncbi:MAG: protein-glutamate O-methyltransferase CheR [Gemmatimonadetes bacterium]|nr:protein-glutamate O-methyltransferase CheR [Gemmatimonadota bacterium]